MKHMPLLGVVTSILCMALVPAAGQQTPAPQWKYLSPIELHSSSRVETLLPAEGGVIGPIRCDADQNMYWLSEAGSLLRMSSDGQRITSFDVEAVTKLRQISTTRGEIADFAVTPDGKLYASVTLEKSSYIVGFRSNDRDTSLTKLEAPEYFRPVGLVAFSNGNFLIAGEAPSEKGQLKPLTAIFDQSGRMVSDLTFKRDRTVTHPQSDSAEDTLPVILNGNAASADDGNVYVMRRFSNPLVYVVSPVGQLQRVLKIIAPKEFEPIYMTLANGQILFDFQKREMGGVELLYGVYATTDGSALRFYRPGDDVRGIFACYADNEFVFLSAVKGKRVIIRSRP